MASRQKTAGNTRKSHHSRKTSAGKTESSAVSSTPANPLAALLSSQLSNRDTPSLPPMTLEERELRDVPTELPKEKQPWYRPPDSKARKMVEKIVVMREAGRPDHDIAKRLKTTEGAVRQYIYLGKKNGWLDAEGEPIDVELELALTIDQKVIRNISKSLDGGMTNYQTHEMTIAAAKGRGMFKTHEVSKNEQIGGMDIVAIKIVMPPVGAADQMPELSENMIGGVPAYADAEVIDDEPAQIEAAMDAGSLQRITDSEDSVEAHA